MEGTLKVKFHPSSCHQAGLGALYRFLLCENLLAEIKILDVLKKKKSPLNRDQDLWTLFASLILLSYRGRWKQEKDKIFRLCVTDE